jgi:LysR family cys regulon transcriptional activator
MTLTQLRYLIAIVDARLNMTLASDLVHATQPAISKQVKLLEEELGFQIFARYGKSLAKLSPAGAQVIERARVILAEAANIRSLAANERRESAGELVIATTQTQARFVLPPALKRLKETWPEVSVRLNLFADLGQSVQANEGADLMIASAGLRPQTHDIVIPLYRWRRVAVAPKDHPLAVLGRPLSLADLAEQPLIGYESPLGSHSSATAAFTAAGLSAQFAYAAHDTEVIKAYVRAGPGVGLVAEMTSGDEDLVRLPVDGLPPCETYAILPRDRVARDYVINSWPASRPISAAGTWSAASIPAAARRRWAQRRPGATGSARPADYCPAVTRQANWASTHAGPPEPGGAARPRPCAIAVARR